MIQAEIKNLTLMIDVEDKDPKAIREAIELINLTLQREPYGLCAQLSTYIEPEVVYTEIGGAEEEDCD